MITLAADLGGTTLKIGLVQQGSVLQFETHPVEPSETLRQTLDAIAARWEVMLSERHTGLTECRAVSLALPFLFHPTQPRVVGDFGKFPQATEVDLRDWASSRLGLPVVAENDLRAALLGEAFAGAARGHQHVVMLAIGTGIGCAALSEGHLFRGSHKRAATLLGHSTVSLSGPPGRCGNPGCAEDLASTATLTHLAHRHPGFQSSSLRQSATLDYQTIFQHADAGDACSRDLLAKSLEVWATVALNAALAFDPDVLVLGGGVLRRHETVVPAVQSHLDRCLAGFEWRLPVVAATLGDRAALIGCERLAISSLTTS